MACTEPNDPSLPLIGCCGAAGPLIWIYLGGEQGPDLGPCNPYHPAAYMSGNRGATSHLGGIADPGALPNQRHVYWVRGVWEALPFPFDLDTALVQSEFINLPSCPFFPFGTRNLNSEVRLLGNTTHVVVNTIGGKAYSEPGTYRFNRLVDIAPAQGGIRFASASYRSVTVAVGQSKNIFNRNGGCSLDEYFLGPNPGAPVHPYSPALDGPKELLMIMNAGFERSYASADPTPFIMTDIVPPIKCEP